MFVGRLNAVYRGGREDDDTPQSYNGPAGHVIP